MNAYTVYILRCRDASLYTGITTDVTRRFKEHLVGKGGNYTRSHKVVKILYTEIVKDRSSALKREAAIKRLSRVKKLELIKDAQKNSQHRNIRKKD